MDTHEVIPLATPAYVPLDPDKPNGATQPPDQYSASDLANVRALRDAVITGALQGWSYSQANSSRPATRTWASGVYRIQMASTYGGTNNLPLTVAWLWSNDSGASYVQIGATANLTWNTAGVVLTAADNSAGLWLQWLVAMHKAVFGLESIIGHTDLTGAAVHGLGTMSTQNANAVAITGGTLVNAGITASGLTNSYINGALRSYPAAPPTLASGAVWDWAATPSQCNMAAGGTVAGISNPQVGEVKRLYVSGGGVTFGTSTGITVFLTTGSAFGAGGNVASLVCVQANVVVVSIANF